MKVGEFKKDACGVFGICNPEHDVVQSIYCGLMSLQHRGQESAGISTLKNGRLSTRKVWGLVSQNLKPKLWRLSGHIGIGHVRYSTTGSSTLANAQPMTDGHFAFAHNGNVANYMSVRKRLLNEGLKLRTNSDAEIMLRIFRRYYEKSGDYTTAIKSMVSQLDGGYSILILTRRGELIAVRDPLGIRPLCQGKMEGSIAFASESVALDGNNIRLVGDVKPGTLVVAGRDGDEAIRYNTCNRRAHCMFEYVYFSRVDSIIEGRSVYDVRFNLGVNLAKTYDVESDVVIPVPDTSRTAAEGYSRQTGAPVAEGLIKNRYIHRTFIMPRQRDRDAAMKLKINPLKSVVTGKKILIIDDSIVRGTTSKAIVNMVKNAGARKVHMMSTCPPIVSPCFYGIDIASYGELIAARMDIESIKEKIGSDSLGYQTIDGLVNAIGLPKEDLCLGCLTGEYPTPYAQRILEALKERSGIGRTRAWEAEISV
ncbi:MAG: amidophosphoribosyltransferase [Candidatus Bathyarchaeia archaeon]